MTRPDGSGDGMVKRPSRSVAGLLALLFVAVAAGVVSVVVVCKEPASARDPRAYKISSKEISFVYAFHGG